MHSICLQAGHQNVRDNCDAELATGTGAPGEIVWTPLIRKKVADLLKAHGFKVTGIDANTSCLPPGDPQHGPYDLTLSLHYQSDNPKNPGKISGFGVFVPAPFLDEVNPHSIAIAKTIGKVYAKRTGLADYSDTRVKGAGPTWANPNTQEYYLWRSQLGPLVLIECGVGAVGAKDHTLLWTHIDKVAFAIAEGICTAFGVPFVVVPKPVPTPAPTPVPAPPSVPEPPSGRPTDGIPEPTEVPPLTTDPTRHDIDALGQEIIDLIGRGDGIEAGFKTSEFWLLAIAVAADLAGPAIGLALSSEERMLIAAGLVSFYGAYRTWRKANGPAKLYAELLKRLAELRGMTPASV